MEDTSDEECNTSLYLGLGIKREKKKQKLANKPCFNLAFELCPKNEAIKVHTSHKDNTNDNNNKGERFSLEYYPNVTTCSTDSDNNNTDRRKKLRLTKEQSAMLENTFKLHNTLNPVQKKTLADQLKLKTRQIEVWFQNRRARTKLKQTEIDYELLKKQCQNLSDENKRLKKELQELKVRQSPLCPQRLSIPVCSSCDQKLLKRNEDNNDN